MKRFFVLIVFSLVFFSFIPAAHSMNLAQYRAKIERFMALDKAVPLHEQAIKDSGNDMAYKAEAYYNLGKRYLAFEKPDLARATAQRALKELTKEHHYGPYAILSQADVMERKPEDAKKYMLLAAKNIGIPEVRQTLTALADILAVCASAIEPYTLWTAYERDWPAADKQYKGKEVVLYGPIWLAKQDYLSYVGTVGMIGFDAYRSLDSGVNVACFLDEASRAKMGKQGDFVLLMGTCIGRFRDMVFLENCRIIDAPMLFGEKVLLHGLDDEDKLKMMTLRSFVLGLR